MERLTKKEGVITQTDKDGNITKNEFIEVKDKDEAYKKLCELENIEQELGIDLITLFKALKYGVYYYTSQNQLTHDYVWLFNNHISVCGHDKLSYSFLTCFQKQILSFEDYMTMWAINREELEQCLEKSQNDK